MAKKDDKFNELINLQPSDIRDWLIFADKLLIDSGCKAAVDNKGNFTYTSKKSNKIVCRITISEHGCTIRPNTINATDSSNMAAQFPENMLDVMRDARGCGGCAKKNPNFVECGHGGPYKFAHNGEDFEGCRFVGFNFSIENAAERNLLEKWIELEVSQ